MDEFDAIVVGAGPAGQVCAGELAEAGLEVAIVEADLVGGECAYYSCMPSKALLRPEELRREVGRVPGLTPGADGPLDPEAVLRRRDEVVRNLDDEAQLPWFEERGVELLRGRARLDGPLRVEVENGDAESAGSGRSARARRAVVVATGSGALMPPIPGLDRVDPWNNRQGTVAQEVPTSMVVLGGGPVGCELAQAWASLGSKVSLIEGGDRLLSGEERFASTEVSEGLVEAGVEVILGVEVDGLEPVRMDDMSRSVSASLTDGRKIEAAELLIAIGRKPRVGGLGLESVGVHGDGPIEVDGRMRATGVESAGDDDAERQPWLYAVGDVNGRALLTHMGKYQARIAAANILASEDEDGPVAFAGELGSPRVTFTDPQVAAVGLTESEARGRGLEVAVTETNTAGTPGASFQGRGTAGTSRLVADTGRGVLVGATFVGFATAELLHAATVAIVAEVPIERLRHAPPAFPTRSEIWLDLLAGLPATAPDARRHRVAG